MDTTIVLLRAVHSRPVTAVTLQLINSLQDIGHVRSFGQDPEVQQNHHHQTEEVSTDEGRLLQESQGIL